MIEKTFFKMRFYVFENLKLKKDEISMNCCIDSEFIFQTCNGHKYRLCKRTHSVTPLLWLILYTVEGDGFGHIL